jgi:adenylate cyclase
MGLEIERKFLVTGTPWKTSNGRLRRGTPIMQGYLSASKDMAIRVRLAGKDAWITVKGAARDIARLEFEYKIPATDAKAILTTLAKATLTKTRYKIRWKSHIWDVDVFEGLNAGLVIAEIELKSVREKFELPPWVSAEVTHDPRYLNSNLSQKPWSLWPRRSR